MSDAKHGDDAAAVGFFWVVGELLIVVSCALSVAEPYGDCLTHPAGHYERWEQWRELGSNRRKELGLPEAIAVSEYDEWPRGRVVYETSPDRFVLYVDQRLLRVEIIESIKGALQISGLNILLRRDAHYR